MTTKLYRRLKEVEVPISHTMYNYFLWSAVNFTDHYQLIELLYEVTIFGVKLDINTYIKLFSYLYYMDNEVRVDRKDFLTYLYTLFGKDHGKEVYNWGTDLFKHYIETNITEFEKI